MLNAATAMRFIMNLPYSAKRHWTIGRETVASQTILARRFDVTKHLYCDYGNCALFFVRAVLAVLFVEVVGVFAALDPLDLADAAMVTACRLELGA